MLKKWTIAKRKVHGKAIKAGWARRNATSPTTPTLTPTPAIPYWVGVLGRVLTPSEQTELGIQLMLGLITN